MTITPLQDNKGIIPVLKGQVHLHQSSMKMIHIIPLQPYQSTIDKSTEIFLSIKNNMNLESRQLLDNKVTIISAKIEQAQNNLKEILPERQKRGLIDALGTIIKDITGNLDNNDLKDIQNALNTLDKNQDALEVNNNKQVLINQQMITRIDEIKTIVETNLHQINKTITKSMEQINDFAKLIIFEQQMNRLEYTVDVLNDHLEDLLDTITFSKNKVISRHLLNSYEMQYINNFLHKDNVVIPYESAILNLLEVKGLITEEKQLIYIIGIPKFNTQLFQLYEIIPIPVLNKILYPTPPKFIILNHNQYKYSTIHECENIYGTYYCPQETLLPTEGTCIPALINLQIATCNYTNTSWKPTIIQINENTIFTEPGPASLEFTSDCTRNSNKISKTSIVTISNCYITINNKNFTSLKPQNFSNIFKTLPWNDVNIQHILPEINIHEIHNWTIENIQAIHNHHKGFQLNTTIVSTSFGLTLILLIIICLIIFKLRTQVLPRVFQFHRNQNTRLRGEELDKIPTNELQRIIHDNINDIMDNAQSIVNKENPVLTSENKI